MSQLPVSVNDGTRSGLQVAANGFFQVTQQSFWLGGLDLLEMLTERERFPIEEIPSASGPVQSDLVRAQDEAGETVSPASSWARTRSLWTGPLAEGISSIGNRSRSVSISSKSRPPSQKLCCVTWKKPFAATCRPERVPSFTDTGSWDIHRAAPSICCCVSPSVKMALSMPK